MAISQDTASTLTNWYSNYQSGAAAPSSTPAATSYAASTPAASSTTGATFGGTAMKSAAAPAASKAPASGGNYDVAAWYRNAAGREGDADGLAYWRNALAEGNDPNNVYKDFMGDLINNGEYKIGQEATPKPQTPTTLDLAQLYQRGATSQQTVAGQLRDLLDANGNYIQSARDRSMRTASDRGLLNSSIAASGGEAAAYEAALPIATSDAQLYRDIDSYNSALMNQGLMYNADAQNTFTGNQMQIDANAANNTANLANQTKNNNASLANQLTISQLQAETSKYQTDKNNAQSQYNTDAGVKNQAEQNKTTLVNNIIQSAELSPDRKAALLRQLGEEGLASAIFLGSVSDDLDFSQGY